MNPYELLLKSKPKELPHPPKSLDYADHAVSTALAGYPELAADSLLNPRLVGKIAGIIGSIVRQLNLLFVRPKWVKDEAGEETVLQRGYAYSLLLEIALNLFGMERKWAGFTDDDVEESLRIIREALASWEAVEREESGEPSIAQAVAKLKIDDMKKVMAGDPKRVGMVARMGENIESRIDWDKSTISFLDAAKDEIQSNIYYAMYERGMCRFGNDYAIGLRWLRRLGFVQVSTNPQLAAIAYRDDPSLWDKLRDYFKEHPELLENIDSRADELAMVATMLALWPNMEVFRPVAYLLNFTDGMVSYQLNPNVADSVEGSLEDALKIYSATQEYFRKYDDYLLWGWPADVERGRPNIVFKVAGSSPAAIDITRELESLGIGTNNTVTYTVSQETALILAKMEGMAKATKMGIRTTKVYETNMGGRLEGHLREVKAAELIMEALKKYPNPEAKLFELAKKLGVPAESKEGAWTGETGWGYSVTAKTLEEKVALTAFRAYLRPLTKEPFAEFLAEAGVLGVTKKEVMARLKEWEEAIGLSGTLVAQRVWWIFFSPENRPKWLAYLIRKYGLSPEKAREILNNIDVLPASKRKPMDTYLTLARNNMTNTEFPNHQLSVLEESKKSSFNLDEYDDAIMRRHNQKLIQLLMQLEDFVKAYELTPELAEALSEAGVYVNGFGLRGLKPEEWGSFGSKVKTMTGFTEAYNKFRERVVQVAKEVARELNK